MSDDDPFERLGPDEDRDGDPFDRLGTVEDDDEPDPSSDASDETGAENTDPSDGTPDEDLWGLPGEDGDNGPSSDHLPGPDASDDPPSTTTGDETDPFDGVTTPEGSPFDAGGTGAFERVDIGSADPDQVWESITGEDDADEPAQLPDEGRYSEVSKHRYCEHCEYFSSPPDVSCSHETAEIIEFLDVETVRLLNCPVVAERQALEQE